MDSRSPLSVKLADALYPMMMIGPQGLNSLQGVGSAHAPQSSRLDTYPQNT